jgi:hypothetical protein
MGFISQKTAFIAATAVTPQILYLKEHSGSHKFYNKEETGVPLDEWL